MYRLTTKIGLTILCLSSFELYSRWVPLIISVTVFATVVLFCGIVFLKH